MTVGKPHLLLMLIGLIPLFILYIVSYFNGRASLRAIGSSLYKEKLLKAYFHKFILSLFFVAISYTALVVALSDIRWKKVYTVKQSSGVDIVFAVDISNSMMSTDVAPNRLERVKRILSGLVEERENCRYSLVAFKGTAIQQIPMTEDIGAFYSWLDILSPSMITVPGTSIQDGLKRAISSFPSGKETRKIIYLFTDGGHQDTRNLFEVIEEIKKEKIKLVPIICGTESGAPVVLDDNRILNDKNGNPMILPINLEALNYISQAANCPLLNLSNAGLVNQLQGIVQEEIGWIGVNEHSSALASETTIFLLISFFSIVLFLMVRIHKFGGIY